MIFGAGEIPILRQKCRSGVVFTCAISRREETETREYLIQFSPSENPNHVPIHLLLLSKRLFLRVHWMESHGRKTICTKN